MLTIITLITLVLVLLVSTINALQDVKITEIVIYNETVYAMMTNAGVGEPAPKSQDYFISLPTGWQLAKNDAATKQVTVSNWNYVCYVTEDGTGVGSVASCGNNLLETKIDSNKTYYKTLFTNNAVIISKPAEGLQLNMDTMKALVLTTNSTGVVYQYISNELGKRGIPYEMINSVNTNDFKLTDDNNKPKYFAIMLVSQRLGVQVPSTGKYVSSLSDEKWTEINQYCVNFKVKTVSYSTYPNDSFLATNTSSGSINDEFLIPAASGWGFSPLLIPKEHKIWATTVKQQPSSINAADVFKPLAVISKTAKDDGQSANNIVVWEIERATGQQELHISISTGSASPQADVIAGNSISFATQNVSPVSSSSGPNAALIGGIVGGVVGFIFLVILGFCCRRRIKDASKQAVFKVEAMNMEKEETAAAYDKYA